MKHAVILYHRYTRNVEEIKQTKLLEYEDRRILFITCNNIVKS